MCLEFTFLFVSLCITHRNAQDAKKKKRSNPYKRPPLRSNATDPGLGDRIRNPDGSIDHLYLRSINTKLSKDILNLKKEVKGMLKF